MDQEILLLRTIGWLLLIVGAALILLTWRLLFLLNRIARRCREREVCLSEFGVNLDNVVVELDAAVADLDRELGKLVSMAERGRTNGG